MTKKPETVKEEDLIKRKDGLYYKKYARVPFTGILEELPDGSRMIWKHNFKNGKLHGPSEGCGQNGHLLFKLIAKEDDLRTKLIEEGELSHEAIEKFLILDKEITRCYAFADAALPIDIFKPHKSKIKHLADAAEYFTNSFDKYHEGAKDDVIYELWDWFEGYFKDFSKSSGYLGSWEYNQGDYTGAVEYKYVHKFSELPFEYVCKSFNLNEDPFASNPLAEFFGPFDDYFYASWINVDFDWDRMRHYYDTYFGKNDIDLSDKYQLDMLKQYNSLPKKVNKAINIFKDPSDNDQET